MFPHFFNANFVDIFEKELLSLGLLLYHRCEFSAADFPPPSWPIFENFATCPPQSVPATWYGKCLLFLPFSLVIFSYICHRFISLFQLGLAVGFPWMV